MWRLDTFHGYWLPFSARRLFFFFFSLRHEITRFIFIRTFSIFFFFFCRVCFSRGTCHQIIESENSISVKLVDYGNIISVKFKDISHLLPCFRELPCLAIKAELAGIECVFFFLFSSCTCVLEMRFCSCNVSLASLLIDASAFQVSHPRTKIGILEIAFALKIWFTKKF